MPLCNSVFSGKLLSFPKSAFKEMSRPFDLSQFFCHFLYSRQVVWDNVRVLKGSGETVSVDGTHLGHNLPDRKGNRYCINLVR